MSVYTVGPRIVAPPPAFDRVAKRQMLAIVTDLWHAITVVPQAPVVEEMYARLRTPRPGDLVYEQSTAYWLLYRDPDLADSRWDGQFITYSHTRTEQVPAGDPAEGEFFTETFEVCLNPDGTEFKWSNADLRAVPDGSPRQW